MDVLETVFPATVGVVNALDKFLAVPQLFLTGLQVLMKIMSIFPHQLSTCVTTALKRFWTMFRWCKYERVGWRFWFAPHVFFWILCVREYRHCWQFRCNSSRKLQICLTISPATPSKQCWRCRVALSLVLDLRISSAWWRDGSAVRIPNSCSGWQCAVLVRNTTLHWRGSGEVGDMPLHTIVTT